jgi:transposase InsO family protein
VCRLLGRSRATHYRRARGPVLGPKPRRSPGPQALDPGERAAVPQVINQTGHGELSIGRIWIRELDENRYWYSLSSMYRIAAAAGQTRERRRQATHPAKVKPELVADGPSQVWSWDITKLRGPVKGVWYHLYVLIDIYSRYNPGWILAAAEDSVLARDFIDEAIARNGQVPHTVHADRGTSMTSQPVSALLANLGVTRTQSRPRISDDNPFSEARFKTLKNLHDFPGSFPNLSAARAFCDGFFTEYNHVHRHPGSAGIPRPRSTSRLPDRSTPPARTPPTSPAPPTPSVSLDAPAHPRSPTTAGSTNQLRNYRKLTRTVSFDLTDTGTARTIRDLAPVGSKTHATSLCALAIELCAAHVQIRRHMTKVDVVPVDVGALPRAQVATVRESVEPLGSRVFIVGA